MKYAAILFDLDGTLLYTIEDLTDSVNFIMRKYGFEERSIADVTSFVGNGLTRLLELCLPQGDATDDFDELVVEFKNHYAEHSCIKTRPYDGITNMLAALKNKGFKMAIVTNKTQRAADMLHDKFFKEYVDFTVGDTKERKRKPHPDNVRYAMEKLNVTPDECLYVGDSEVDKATADNAEIPCALVAWGFRGESKIKALLPEYVIKTPNELVEILS